MSEWVSYYDAGMLYLSYGDDSYVMMRGGITSPANPERFLGMGWKPGQGIFFLDMAHISEPLTRKAFPSATIVGRWVFIDPVDLVMIKMRAE